MKTFLKVWLMTNCLFLFIAIPITGHCSDESLADVEKLLDLLSDPESGTLADYYYFCGRGAETESMIELIICEEYGWNTTDTEDYCTDFLRKREENSETTKSFYMIWLKSRFIKYSNIEIIEINRYDKGDYFDHELIKAKLGNNFVSFFRTINPVYRVQFGAIHVTDINGVDINEMFEEDLKSGYIKDLIMSDLKDN